MPDQETAQGFQWISQKKHRNLKRKKKALKTVVLKIMNEMNNLKN